MSNYEDQFDDEALFKPHAAIRMIKVKDVPRTRAIRLYKSCPEIWNLQLRAPIGLGTSGLSDGKDFIVASADCTADDLRAIRNAIDEALGGPALVDRLDKIANVLEDKELSYDDQLRHIEELRKITRSLKGETT